MGVARTHSPPENGGVKCNPTDDGPADTDITGWIQNRANALLENGLKDVKRVPFAKARKSASTHEHDYLDRYVGDLASIIHFDALRSARIPMAVAPPGSPGLPSRAPLTLLTNPTGIMTWTNQGSLAQPTMFFRAKEL